MQIEWVLLHFIHRMWSEWLASNESRNANFIQISQMGMPGFLKAHQEFLQMVP